MSIAIAYPIRENPNQYQDELLKYSLRSLQKHGRNYSRVYMVGERRPWFSKSIDVVNLKHNDHKRTKFSKVTDKMTVFCHANIPFVLMNDDFILSEPYDFTMKRYHVFGTLKQLYDTHTDKVYKNLIELTVKNTPNEWWSPSHLTHTPFLVGEPHKSVEYYEGKLDRYRPMYSFRQFMASIQSVGPPNLIELERDVKIRETYRQAQWVEKLRTSWMHSFCPRNVNSELMGALERIYPEKSIYEI